MPRLVLRFDPSTGNPVSVLEDQNIPVTFGSVVGCTYQVYTGLKTSLTGGVATKFVVETDPAGNLRVFVVGNPYGKDIRVGADGRARTGAVQVQTNAAGNISDVIVDISGKRVASEIYLVFDSNPAQHSYSLTGASTTEVWDEYKQRALEQWQYTDAFRYYTERYWHEQQIAAQQYAAQQHVAQHVAQQYAAQQQSFAIFMQEKHSAVVREKDRMAAGATAQTRGHFRASRNRWWTAKRRARAEQYILEIMNGATVTASQVSVPQPATAQRQQQSNQRQQQSNMVDTSILPLHNAGRATTASRAATTAAVPPNSEAKLFSEASRLAMAAAALESLRRAYQIPLDEQGVVGLLNRIVTLYTETPMFKGLDLGDVLSDLFDNNPMTLEACLMGLDNIKTISQKETEAAKKNPLNIITQLGAVLAAKLIQFPVTEFNQAMIEKFVTSRMDDFVFNVAPDMEQLKIFLNAMDKRLTPAAVSDVKPALVPTTAATNNAIIEESSSSKSTSTSKKSTSKKSTKKSTHIDDDVDAVLAELGLTTTTTASEATVDSAASIAESYSEVARLIMLGKFREASAKLTPELAKFLPEGKASLLMLMLAMQQSDNAKNSKHDYDELTKYLIEHAGAAIAYKDKDGNTVMHYWAKSCPRNLRASETLFKTLYAAFATYLKDHSLHRFLANPAQLDYDQVINFLKNNAGETFLSVLINEIMLKSSNKDTEKMKTHKRLADINVVVAFMMSDAETKNSSTLLSDYHCEILLPLLIARDANGDNIFNRIESAFSTVPTDLQEIKDITPKLIIAHLAALLARLVKQDDSVSLSSFGTEIISFFTSRDPAHTDPVYRCLKDPSAEQLVKLRRIIGMREGVLAMLEPSDCSHPEVRQVIPYDYTVVSEYVLALAAKSGGVNTPAFSKYIDIWLRSEADSNVDVLFVMLSKHLGSLTYVSGGSNVATYDLGCAILSKILDRMDDMQSKPAHLASDAYLFKLAVHAFAMVFLMCGESGMGTDGGIVQEKSLEIVRRCVAKLDPDYILTPSPVGDGENILQIALGFINMRRVGPKELALLAVLRETLCELTGDPQIIAKLFNQRSKDPLSSIGPGEMGAITETLFGENFAQTAALLSHGAARPPPPV